MSGLYRYKALFLVVPIFVYTLAPHAADAGVVTLVSDGFDDGWVSNGSDPLDLNWVRDHSDGIHAVPNDPAFGGNAMGWDPGFGTFRGLVGAPFRTYRLDQPGRMLQLSFDFHFNIAPPEWESVFRFGLYNTNGTLLAGNGGSEAQNDFGYYFNVSGADAPNHQLFREHGGQANSGSGTDRVQLGPDNTTSPPLQDNQVHSFLMRLTRTETGLQILVEMDGETYANYHDSSPYLEFNEVAFNAGALSNAGNRRYRFDNITVSAAVPEPSTIALAAVGGLLIGAAGWRRGRAKRSR